MGELAVCVDPSVVVGGIGSPDKSSVSLSAMTNSSRPASGSAGVAGDRHPPKRHPDINRPSSQDPSI